MKSNQYFNVKSSGVTPSGIAYQRPQLTGQTTSYRTGDDGWHYANGTYDYTPPLNPTYIAELSDFITLVNNNVFGNTNRFTDENGGQTYLNEYVIDHYTGLGYKRVPNSIFVNWNNSIDAANSATDFGFNDWRVPNRNEMYAIAKNDNLPAGVDPLDYSPFNYNPNYYMTTSTTWYSSTYALYLYIGCTVVQQTKTTTSNTICWICRNHY